MARPLHIVLVCLLMLQCSPLCFCALAHEFSEADDGAQQAAPVPVTSLPDCPADRGGPRDCPCFCACSVKTMIAPAAKATMGATAPALQSRVLLAVDPRDREGVRLGDSANHPDRFASQPFPRLN